MESEIIRIYSDYKNIDATSFFSRTAQQQEIDYVEEGKGTLSAFEFKWNKRAKSKFSKTFTSNYKPAHTMTVTPANFESFLEY